MRERDRRFEVAVAVVFCGCTASSSDSLSAGERSTEKLLWRNAPRAPLSPENGRATELAARNDIRAHVGRDPAKLGARGEYCGIVVRNLDSNRYFAFQTGANRQLACHLSGYWPHELARSRERITMSWHSHPTLPSREFDPPTGDDVSNYLRYRYGSPPPHEWLRKAALDEYAASWVFMSRKPEISYRIRSVRVPTSSVYYSVHRMDDLFLALVNCRATPLMFEHRHTRHSAALLAFRSLAHPQPGRYVDCVQYLANSALTDLPRRKVDELATGVAVDFTSDGERTMTLDPSW